MGFFPSQGGSIHHTSEPTARVAPAAPARQRLSTSLAAQRQLNARVHRLQPKLEEIEQLQHELRLAGQALGAIVGSAPLAKAYAQFQHDGGITAADWEDWLAGKKLPRSQYRSKRHLRLIVSQDNVPLTRRISSGNSAA